MRWSEHLGSIVTLTDTRNGSTIIGRLIRVIPGVRITLETGPMALKDIRIGKRDIVDLNPATDRMVIRMKPVTERQMRVEPLTESAFRAMENLLAELAVGNFDALMESKLG